MKTRALVFALALAAFPSTGCCKACGAVSDIAKEIKGPEAAEGERLVKERITTDKELRKRICGVDTRELTSLVIKKNPVGNYSIQGTPVERYPAKSVAAKADAGPGKSPVDPTKVLECVAVVGLLWNAKESGGKTTWSIHQLDVEEISTPGSEYKRPSADWD
ncbi:MAG TPA: hypothetical protein PK156_02475 [Polyangium sp.]|nr:hypothetical protein [Polyangium sp.]